MDPPVSDTKVTPSRSQELLERQKARLELQEAERRAAERLAEEAREHRERQSATPNQDQDQDQDQASEESKNTESNLGAEGESDQEGNIGFGMPLLESWLKTQQATPSLS